MNNEKSNLGQKPIKVVSISLMKIFKNVSIKIVRDEKNNLYYNEALESLLMRHVSVFVRSTFKKC